ncbi:D-lactate dehydrogenase [Parashewanella tropica]|uniref:D-lactate dehydrogenase n=1 Tax=Parashewanella tropica TaxID=2547970 RepID=UPI001059845E|nr:D-lactate dehydrogenase [Parashewanella tropica]
MKVKALLCKLGEILTPKQLLTSDSDTKPYRKGFRDGFGPAVAVALPSTLWQQYQIIETCVEAGAVIIMQAANTGLTGGSTPTDGVERPTVIINTLQINNIHFLESHQQIVALSGATLFDLERRLKLKNREPHSVIGSSCIGASIVGGVCNNSGGALVERGPAYTELALYAEVDESGKLVLKNELDIDLGNNPEEILTRLQYGLFTEKDIIDSGKKASDDEYQHYVRDIQSSVPARFNADSRRLYQASGCAGKLAVFAVRLDSFEQAERTQAFFISTNSADKLQLLRRKILQQGKCLPISAEYIHHDAIHLAEAYGRDTVFMIKRFGSSYLPSFFKLKKQLSGLLSKLGFGKNGTTDYISHLVFKVLGSQTPALFRNLNSNFQHHLIINAKSFGIDEIKQFVAGINTDCSADKQLNLIELNAKQANDASLLRYACASAAIQYEAVHSEEVDGLVALDIALPRNCMDWFEELPESLSNKLVYKNYYGHFLCHVLHQDYLVKKGENLALVKQELLALCESRGAKYPAEHNVGHHYQAEQALTEHYQSLDPTNTFNAGIGGLSKKSNYE